MVQNTEQDLFTEKYDSAEAGYFINQMVESRYILSLVIKNANKGIISVHEEKGARTEIMHYYIKKEKDFSECDTDYEKTLLEGLFMKPEIEDRVYLRHSKQNKFYDEYERAVRQLIQKVEKNVGEPLLDDSVITKSFILRWSLMLVLLAINIFASIQTGSISNLKPYMFPMIGYLISNYLWISNKIDKYVASLQRKLIKWSLWFLAYIAASNEQFWQMGEDLGYSVAILTVLLPLAAVVLSGIKNRRTASGDKLLAQAIQFKKYLCNADKKQLQQIMITRPDYFYEMLPYAFSLDVVFKWCRCFNSIQLKAPIWYDGGKHKEGSSYDMVNDMAGFLKDLSVVDVSGGHGKMIGGKYPGDGLD